MRVLIMNAKGGKRTDMQQQLMLLDDLIATLAEIWKYSSLDYFLARRMRNISKDIYKANEYAIRLVRLWDTLDRLPRDVVVRTVVELEGSIIGKEEQLKGAIGQERKRRIKSEAVLNKILRTQLEDYLAATD